MFEPPTDEVGITQHHLAAENITASPFELVPNQSNTGAREPYRRLPRGLESRGLGATGRRASAGCAGRAVQVRVLPFTIALQSQTSVAVQGGRGGNVMGFGGVLVVTCWGPQGGVVHAMVPGVDPGGYHLSVAQSDMTPCVDPDQLP